VKLVTAVIQEEDSNALVEALLKAGFYATKIASTGGFLHQGNVTLLVGTEDHDLPMLLEVIRGQCHSRERGAVHVGGAVIFVQEITEYHRV